MFEYIGQGAEGTVHRIGPNLVQKVWHNNWFGDATPAVILERIKAVRETLDNLDEQLRVHCAVPEFAGYELLVPTDDKAPFLITYHEYIEGETSPDDDLEEAVLREIRHWYWDTFFDGGSGKGNIRYQNGKYYLVDVMIDR